MPFVKGANLPQPLRLPLAGEARQAGLAGEELLHGGLFDGALFGDQAVEGFDQRVRVRQGGGDGALFLKRGAWAALSRVLFWKCYVESIPEQAEHTERPIRS